MAGNIHIELVGPSAGDNQPRIQAVDDHVIAEWPDSLVRMASIMSYALTEQYAGEEREVVQERARLAIHLMGYVRMLMVECMTPEQVDLLREEDRRLRRYEWRSLEDTSERSRAKLLEISGHRRNSLLRRRRSSGPSLGPADEA